MAVYEVKQNNLVEIEKTTFAQEVDFTRYDLRIAGQTFPGLWKRQLVLRVVKEAIKRGATPEQVSEAIPGKRVFFTVDGEYNEQQLLAMIPQAIVDNGGSFDRRRYFTADDELIHFGNRTYAFTNQWGDPRTFQAIENIIDLLQTSDITFTPMA